MALLGRCSLPRLCVPEAAASWASVPSVTLPVVLTGTSAAKVFALSSPQMPSQADSVQDWMDPLWI